MCGDTAEFHPVSCADSVSDTDAENINQHIVAQAGLYSKEEPEHKNGSVPPFSITASLHLMDTPERGDVYRRLGSPEASFSEHGPAHDRRHVHDSARKGLVLRNQKAVDHSPASCCRAPRSHPTAPTVWRTLPSTTGTTLMYLITFLHAAAVIIERGSGLLEGQQQYALMTQRRFAPDFMTTSFTANMCMDFCGCSGVKFIPHQAMNLSGLQAFDNTAIAQEPQLPYEEQGRFVQMGQPIHTNMLTLMKGGRQIEQPEQIKRGLQWPDFKYVAGQASQHSTVAAVEDQLITEKEANEELSCPSVRDAVTDDVDEARMGMIKHVVKASAGPGERLRITTGQTGR